LALISASLPSQSQKDLRHQYLTIQVVQNSACRHDPVRKEAMSSLFLCHHREESFPNGTMLRSAEGYQQISTIESGQLSRPMVRE